MEDVLCNSASTMARDCGALRMLEQSKSWSKSIMIARKLCSLELAVLAEHESLNILQMVGEALDEMRGI